MLLYDTERFWSFQIWQRCAEKVLWPSDLRQPSNPTRLMTLELAGATLLSAGWVSHVSEKATPISQELHSLIIRTFCVSPNHFVRRPIMFCLTVQNIEFW